MYIYINKVVFTTKSPFLTFISIDSLNCTLTLVIFLFPKPLSNYTSPIISPSMPDIPNLFCIALRLAPLSAAFKTIPSIYNKLSFHKPKTTSDPPKMRKKHHLQCVYPFGLSFSTIYTDNCLISCSNRNCNCNGDRS